MKKQEALDLIKSELEKGTSKEEIKEILMSQEKIGNNTPTEVFVESLFPEEAVSVDDKNESIAEKNLDEVETEASPKKADAKSGCNYEKWVVALRKDGVVKDKIKKVKDVNIPDHVAESLNKASSRGIKGTIYYIKK
ncbi:hypothetical protein M2459_001354 [Parabacteroides sp. PF5-5]|uniref:hypothetical protein n=1 Tax=unclassified Parabacteroides TaxID=2649774 RepID=UPI0024739BD5|nr:MULTISPECIES: hypothetical protein [unclassified Parabacteroides]MDH6304619.1 hypothetical protein [Parabacteroides sp. PH5-39]MDH6315768.1 hypothetical protein [Parabacteroides sp. PF5-13]MDH6319427.1 hypothetical protein [Parabacteroides sp. PH5-13]MDH6323158.1 hypothetical protein [Parabacteroides sp. PH5-8]MDH6326960.1 hypothetical protein [Parabacteroides sp. PH5-41]